MSNNKHTAGPWGLQTLTKANNGYQDWPVFCIRSGGSNKGGCCIATVGDVDRATAPRNAANAQLIHAAPDLLDALKECESVIFAALAIGKHGLIQDKIESAHKNASAAITKATTATA